MSLALPVVAHPVVDTLPQQKGRSQEVGTRVRMEFCYALVECELHAHLRTALAKQGGNITSRFAIRDEGESEDEDEVME